MTEQFSSYAPENRRDGLYRRGRKSDWIQRFVHGVDFRVLQPGKVWGLTGNPVRASPPSGWGRDGPMAAAACFENHGG